MASAVQRPGYPGQVAITMRGRKGVGKGFFAHEFGKLWGRHFKAVTNPDHVVGKFNATLKDAALVFADECFAPNNKKHEGALKVLITDPRIPVEMKGVDPVQMRNCTKLVMASNEDWVVPASHDERRYFVLDVGEGQRRNRAYFKTIEGQMRGGGYEALLHTLLTLDLSGFDVTAVPETVGLREQKALSLGPLDRWFQDLLERGALPGNDWKGWPGRGRTEALVDDARRGEPSLRDHGETQITDYLKRWGCEPKKQKGGPRFWSFPALEGLRDRWCLNYGKRKWSTRPEWVQTDRVF